MIDFFDKTTEEPGTPINRETLMGIQGFENIIIRQYPDGTISETNEWGEELVTTFEPLKITQVFSGGLTIRKIITLKENDITRQEAIE